MSLRTEIQGVQVLIERGKTTSALAILRTCILANSDDALFFVRSQGCFRSSKYEFRVYRLQSIIAGLLADNYGPEWKAYLQSVQNLLYIASSLRGTFSNLLSHISRYRGSRLKEMLACVELHWLARTMAIQASSKDHTEAFAWSNAPERLAECFSFYAYHVFQESTLDDADLGVFDERNVLQGRASDLLSSLSPVLFFQEAEILVDHFSFTASRTLNHVRIVAHDESLSRSIGYGYASSEIAQQNLSSKALRESSKAESLTEFAGKLFEEIGDKLVQLKTPPPRLVVGIPDFPPFHNLIRHESYYSEEYASITTTLKEFLIGHDDFVSKPIFKNLTLLDIIRFQRLFSFLLYGIVSYLRTHDAPGDSIVIRSLVPVMSLSTLRSHAERVMSTEKAFDMIELLIREKNAPGIYDAQYQPVIRACDDCLVPLHLVAQSNLLRSALVISKFRFDSEGNVDPVTTLIADALNQNGFQVIRNHSYSYTGERGEIDVLAYRSGILFAFECKGSLGPTGPAELRTSYDYIQKGRKQLDRFLRAMSSLDFRSALGSRFSHTFDVNSKLITCIVMGNRMFTGYTCGRHPVRPLYGMHNFINAGEVAFPTGAVKLWRGDSFTELDLADYIESNIVDQPFIDALTPVERAIEISGKKMTAINYVLDSTKIGVGLFPNRPVVQQASGEDAIN